MILSKPLDLDPPHFVAVSPEEPSIASLKLRIEKDIALLRILAVDPVDIAYSANISFEVRPIAEGDRFSIYRKNWGGTTVDYSALDMMTVDVFGETDLLPVKEVVAFREQLVDDPEGELLKAEILKVIGWEVKEDPDNKGLWVWLNVASLEGGNQSFESEKQAIDAAWDDAGGRACAAFDCSWSGGTVERQARLLMLAFNADEHPASAPSDAPN